MPAKRPAPVMVIRAARVPAGGWIVHDLRDPRTVRTPPWRGTRFPHLKWHRYDSHRKAINAACRALKTATPLPGYPTAEPR